MYRAKVSKIKQSIYMKGEFLDELNAEAKRQDRSLSWLVTKIWELSKGEIRKFPAVAEELKADE